MSVAAFLLAGAMLALSDEGRAEAADEAASASLSSSSSSASPSPSSSSSSSATSTTAAPCSLCDAGIAAGGVVLVDLATLSLGVATVGVLFIVNPSQTTAFQGVFVIIAAIAALPVVGPLGASAALSLVHNGDGVVWQPAALGIAAAVVGGALGLGLAVMTGQSSAGAMNVAIPTWGGAWAGSVVGSVAAAVAFPNSE